MKNYDVTIAYLQHIGHLVYHVFITCSTDVNECTVRLITEKIMNFRVDTLRWV